MSHAPQICSFAVRSLAIALFATSVHAQCSPSWLPSQGLAGLNGSAITSIMWDPDGPGPRQPLLVVGGEFKIAANLIVNCIATWNPATGQWGTLGDGFGPDTSGDPAKVTALLALPGGDLIAGGNFGSADGATANHVARWDGAHWVPLGGGVSGVQYPIVYSLAALPNGDIIAGGDFRLADGNTANYLARWDGTTWSALPAATNHTFLPVQALATLPDGRLAACDSLSHVVAWDGTDWSPLGGDSATYDAPVTQLQVLPTGELVAVGRFYRFAGIQTRGVALWNGTAWTSLGSGPSTFASSMVVEPNGNIVVVAGSQMRRWNGSAWNIVTTQIPDRPIYTSTLLPDGSFVIGGDFHQIAAGQPGEPNVQAAGIARVNAGTCHSLNEGMNIEINAMLSLPGGDTIAAGNIVLSPQASYAPAIARWTGSQWLPMGAGLGDANSSAYEFSYVLSLVSRPNGEIIAGGIFSSSGATAVNNIASWDGENWHPLAAGLSGAVYALATLPSGDLVAAGDFTSSGTTQLNRIARWNGSQWLPLASGLSGPSGSAASVYALIVLPSGDLIAGGSFQFTGSQYFNHLARWNGSTWSASGGNGAVSTVFSLANAPDGSFVAGGYAGGVGRWNGASWVRLGGAFDNAVFSLKTLSNGDVFAGGLFNTIASTPMHGIARWNGSTWSALANGISHFYPLSYRYVNALTEAPTGVLNVGGYFETAGDVVSPFFARYAFAPVAPAVTRQPISVVTCSAGSISFSAAAGGTDPLLWSWQYESPANTWTDLDEGANNSIGFVTGVHTPSISITNLGSAAASRYRATITNSCGSISSSPATLTICLADFNCDAATDFFDYLDFVEAFASNNAAADFNHDSVINIFDYFDFVQAFSAGC